MRLLANYQNGNYTVKLYEDGTKVKYNDLDNFTPEFAESIDCTITTRCNGGCEYCYMNCTDRGIHADLNNPLLNSLHSGTEIAINGNDLSHPDLVSFLQRMKNKGVIVNITINQKHFNSCIDILKEWQDKDLIHGIGVSLTDSSDETLIANLKAVKHTVLHVIDGCFTQQDLENLKDKNIIMLFLGYKHKGRGNAYYHANKDFVDGNIKFLREHLYDYRGNFPGFAFDNLATQDLDIQHKVSPESWSINHMGEEGEFTFFIDLVHNEYAVSSMETKYIFPIQDGDTVDTMFKHIRSIFEQVRNNDKT